MDQLSWTTRWEVWRELMDAPSSRQRRRVDDFLRTRPALLYWGDSWFSTPLYLNLARQSLLRIDGLAMLIGTPGATASELFTAARVDNITDRIRTWPFDLLCVSAGGNDQLSERLSKVFAAWMPTARKTRIDADAAFDLLLASRGLDTIRRRYEQLLSAVRRKVLPKRPHFRVVAHTYAPLQKIGAKGNLTVSNIGLVAWLKDDVGPWLWRPMRHVLPTLDEGKRFADLLLFDGFRDRVLVPLSEAKEFGNFFSYVDFSSVAGVDDTSFWYDEIHPTEAGFNLLAMTFNRQLRQVLPAPKRVAVPDRKPTP